MKRDVKMNISVTQEVKEDIHKLARLERIPVSRLIERVLMQFLKDNYNIDPCGDSCVAEKGASYCVKGAR